MRDPKHKRNDRPIDRFRNGGGGARVEGNVGPILTMFTIRDQRIYFICEHGLTSAQMADQIDPERINPAMPQVVQRPELAYGATTPFMQRTVCVAVELFNQAHLPELVVRDDGLAKALDAAHALAEVQDAITALAESEAETRRRIEAGEQQRHVVPKTQNLKGRMEGCISSLRQVALHCQELALMFHPRQNRNDRFTPHLRAALKVQLAADDPLWPHVEWCFSQIERLFNYRNAMIHAEDDKRLVLMDYELQADGVLVAPTIEVLHPATPLPRMDVGQFLNDALESVSLVFETYVVGFCDRNARAVPGFRFMVAESEQDRRTGTRYYWHGERLPRFPRNGPQPEAG
ncbi:MAG: hypothetical protein WA840_09125 [Caulobacteraceae bacterium]